MPCRQVLAFKPFRFVCVFVVFCSLLCIALSPGPSLKPFCVLRFFFRIYISHYCRQVLVLNSFVFCVFVLFFCLCIALLSPGPIGPSNLFSFLRFFIMDLIVARSEPYTHFFLHTFLWFFLVFLAILLLYYCASHCCQVLASMHLFFFFGGNICKYMLVGIYVSTCTHIQTDIPKFWQRGILDTYILTER